MKEFTYIIADPHGIHARPAGLLVKECGKFTSKINIKKGDKAGDGKRIFAIMGLAAKKGDELVFQIEGEDEEKAAISIEAFLKENL